MAIEDWDKMWELFVGKEKDARDIEGVNKGEVIWCMKGISVILFG